MHMTQPMFKTSRLLFCPSANVSQRSRTRMPVARSSFSTFMMLLTRRTSPA